LILQPHKLKACPTLISLPGVREHRLAPY
jgi:hypothetical protein